MSRSGMSRGVSTRCGSSSWGVTRCGLPHTGTRSGSRGLATFGTAWCLVPTTVGRCVSGCMSGCLGKVKIMISNIPGLSGFVIMLSKLQQLIDKINKIDNEKLKIDTLMNLINNVCTLCTKKHSPVLCLYSSE